MSDEPSRSGSPQKSWLSRLGQAISGEPKNIDELIEELTEAQQNGLFSAETLRMMEGLLGIAQQHVEDVMVSRANMVTVGVTASLPEVLEIVTESGHSRFPVQGEDKDEIVGILLAKDLLKFKPEQGNPEPIRSLIRPVTLIPESKPLNILLKEFRASRNHMAIVMDEYGGVAGLVTIEDVLEEIVGEIDDEFDEVEDSNQHIRSKAEGRFLVDALTPIDTFNDYFNATLSEEDYDTIGGLVVEGIGHLPEAGEEISFDQFHFRVARADARRVHSFHLTLLSGQLGTP